MLTKAAVWMARHLPSSIKGWVHRHRAVDGLTRWIFARTLGQEGSVIAIESGPLRGIVLAVGEHVSHAHIGGVYELDTQLAIERFVQPGFICYDLGASIGYLTLLMARKAAHVYAFEPAPHAAADIRRHADANGFTHITVVPNPVSDRIKRVSLSLTDVAYGSRIVEGRSEWPALHLTTTTIDDFARRHPAPDFLKIDVEGEEARVLEGARSVLSSKRPIICCELHSDGLAHHLQAILKPLGYSLTAVDGGVFTAIGIVPGATQVMALPPEF